MTNKFYSQHFLSRSLLLLIAWLFVFVLAYVLSIQSVKADSGDNVTGWMWSSNIGWISSNCTDTGSCTSTQDYGLNIDPITGALSGHAWSQNIGYLSFNRSETNNPPEAPFTGGSGPIAVYDSSTQNITGWARFLSGCEDVAGNPVTSCSSTAAGAASGGFDGWVKLSGTATDGSSYGVELVGSDDVVGYAWGASVVGWISFSLKASINPTGNLTIDTPYCEVAEGDTTCAGSVSWDSNNFSGNTSVRQGGTEIYNSSSGSSEPATFDYGNNSFSLVDTGTGNIIAMANVNIGCEPGTTWYGGACIVVPPPPSIDIDAEPNLIRSEQTADVLIDINSNEDLTCYLSGVENSVITFPHTASAATVQYTETTRPLSSTQIVDIECTVDVMPSVSSDASTRIDVISGLEEL